MEKFSVDRNYFLLQSTIISLFCMVKNYQSIESFVEEILIKQFMFS